ncbi:tetratricopeptide repeat protein [Plantactinospora mayteni]|uniref:XRE family transcriptional regulator n=1 Tax=Plantactinospora mayteni TaxID=566021 RepID=A0ABQ4F188_9ACTN|nr:BTAD domain-containing putative transcriptional regulator [Plantactinospora mayteni]GIH00664.1 XRE family transcriptional regulator [Plantactinospora mayteni]
MHFEVLGPVRVRQDGRSLPVRGRLQHILLAVLLARANVEVPTHVLAETLWGEPDERAGPKLQQHVHKLRRVLGDVNHIRFGQDGYCLNVAPDELDAQRFDALLDDGIRVPDGEPNRRAEILRQALGLWRGDPFAGLDVPILTDESARLTERKLIATEDLYEAEIACGHGETTVAKLAELVRLHPLRERSRQLLIIALYGAGRRADALAAYRSAHTTFSDELGVEPGLELRWLQARILAGEPLDAAPTRPVAVNAGGLAVPAQLPRDTPGFVGRATDLSALDGMWSDADDAAPVAAIAGTAGVGKTALAVRWAHRNSGEFPDGQLYVDLHGYGPGDPVTAGDALAGFLRALGVDGAAIPVQLVERAARFRSLVHNRRILVVLDNARTVEQVRPLLPGSRSCFVLVTSRDSLAGLVVRDGARRIDLDRLAPDEALTLVRALIGEQGDPGALTALVDRCARLPLALRIAAESVRTRNGLRVADLVAALGDDVGRLDVLDAGADPHTNIRAVFSWSYRHLPPDAATLFRLMGLHPWDTATDTLAALGGHDQRTTRRALESLARAYLVDELPDGRFGMHDLLRAYAAERAAEDESPAIRQAALRRVFTWYLHTAIAARHVLIPQSPELPVEHDAQSPGIVFSDIAEALAWYGVERPTLASLVTAAAERGEHDLAWRIAAASLAYFNISKHWDDCIATHRTGLDSAVRVGDRAGEATMLNGLGVAYDDIHEFDASLECHLRAAELFAGTGNDHLAAWNLNNLGVTYDRLGRFDEALDRHREAFTLFRAVGDRRGQAYSLNNLGDVHRQRKDFAKAADHLRRALEIQRAVGDSDGQRFTLCSLGDLHRDSGQLGRAADYYSRAVETSLTQGDRWQAAISLVRLADLRQARTVHHLREAHLLFTEIGDTDAAAEVRARLAELGTTHGEVRPDGRHIDRP